MRFTKLRRGDVVQSADDSIYLVRDIFFDGENGEQRAHLDTVIETSPSWIYAKSLNKSLPLCLLHKITHAEGLDDDQ